MSMENSVNPQKNMQSCVGGITTDLLAGEAEKENKCQIRFCVGTKH